MKRLQIYGCAAILLVMLFTNQSQAQGKITWDKDYPKGETQTVGEILLKGKITLDGGWSLKTDKLKVRAWISGEKVNLYENLKVNMDNSWPNVDGILVPESGKNYNVTVEAVLTNGTIDVTIMTEPGKAKAK